MLVYFAYKEIEVEFNLMCFHRPHLLPQRLVDSEAGLWLTCTVPLHPAVGGFYGL